MIHLQIQYITSDCSSVIVRRVIELSYTSYKTVITKNTSGSWHFV